MESTRSDVLPRTENTFFISLRQDLLLLCQSCTYRKSEKSKSSPHCKAFILAVLESWTNCKIDNRENPVISMTMPQWIAALYGLYGYNAIADSLEELAEEGFISREKFKSNRVGRDQYRYLLNFRLINSRLQTLIFPGLQTVTNQGSSLTNQGLNVTNQGLSSSQTIKSKGFIESKDTNIKTNREKERGVSSQSTKPASVQSVFSLEEQKILDWYAKLGTGHKTKQEKAKEILPDLLQHIHSFEEMQELHDYTAKRLREEEKADQTVYLATMRYYMLKRLKERPAQIEQEDPNSLMLHTRYRVYEDFSASADLWFLFEDMTIAEANKHGRAKSGSMGSRTEHLIRIKLKDESDVTRCKLIEQWINERMAVAV